MMKNLLCALLGHDIEGQPVQTVHAFTGPLYEMRECRRCSRRQPVTAEDACRQAEKNSEINSVMNAYRARRGLGWLDFSDGP
jgi:hypothetical protein